MIIVLFFRGTIPYLPPMKHSAQITTLLLLCLYPIITHAQCVTNTSNIHAFVYDGNSYEIVKEKLSWADAAACAVERGGYLASINDKPENDSVFAQVMLAGISTNSTLASDGGPADYLWLGGTDGDAGDQNLPELVASPRK